MVERLKALTSEFEGADDILHPTWEDEETYVAEGYLPNCLFDRKSTQVVLETKMVLLRVRPPWEFSPEVYMYRHLKFTNKKCVRRAKRKLWGSDSI